MPASVSPVMSGRHDAAARASAGLVEVARRDEIDAAPGVHEGERLGRCETVQIGGDVVAADPEPAYVLGLLEPVDEHLAVVRLVAVDRAVRDRDVGEIAAVPHDPVVRIDELLGLRAASRSVRNAGRRAVHVIFVHVVGRRGKHGVEHRHPVVLDGAGERAAAREVVDEENAAVQGRETGPLEVGRARARVAGESRFLAVPVAGGKVVLDHVAPREELVVQVDHVAVALNAAGGPCRCRTG